MTMTWRKYYRKWRLDNVLNETTSLTAAPFAETTEPDGTH
jgi:hypothetical protein